MIRSLDLPDLAAESTRRDLARVATSLLDKWNVSRELRLALLGLNNENSVALSNYEQGVRALAESTAVLDRIGHLLNIHKGLQVLFPESPELRFGWLELRNKRLDGKTPLQVITEEGVMGLASVAQLIESDIAQ